MTLAGTLFIGPLAIACHCEPGIQTPEATGAYAQFYVPGNEPKARHAANTLHVTLRTGDTSLPERPPDFEAGRHWRFYDTDGGPLFGTGFSDRPRPERLCRVMPDGATAQIIVNPEVIIAPDPPPRIRFPLAYPLDQILAWGMLSRIQGTLLHAALIVRPDGKGLLLAGRSGAGKSTLSALCADAGWTVLNDDRALVHFEDGRVLASGTPWHGSGKYAEPRTVPLSGIHFLAQSPSNHVEEIGRSEVLAELLRVAALPVFLDDWCTPTLATLDQLTRAIPMRRLHFQRDPSAVETLSG